MDSIKISFTVRPSSPDVPLGFEAWVDDYCFFNTDHLTSTQTIVYELDDSKSADHQLKFILKNKQLEHTQINDHGDIVKDALITVSNIMFDEIEMNYNMQQQMSYTHNFNGTNDTIVEKCHGDMGCNGTVELTFSTPVYLWLLEHL